MRTVVILTDLEGAAGVVDYTRQAVRGAEGYETARRLLTEEVNAAVEALRQEGVCRIVVIDGHGAGGISYEHLHEAAVLVHGRCDSIHALLGELRGADAAMMIGQHAMAGTARANQSHTQDFEAVVSYRLNDRPIGEIAQFSLYAGSLDVPMILLSGDQAACDEAGQLIRGLTTVAVKQGLGRHAAVSLAAPQARRRIAEAVQQAVARQRQSPLPPLRWTGPFTLDKMFAHPDQADRAAFDPLAERVDAVTIRLRGTDIRELIYR